MMHCRRGVLATLLLLVVVTISVKASFRLSLYTSNKDQKDLKTVFESDASSESEADEDEAPTSKRQSSPDKKYAQSYRYQSMASDRQAAVSPRNKRANKGRMSSARSPKFRKTSFAASEAPEAFESDSVSRVDKRQRRRSSAKKSKAQDAVLTGESEFLVLEGWDGEMVGEMAVRLTGDIRLAFLHYRPYQLQDETKEFEDVHLRVAYYRSQIGTRLYYLPFSVILPLLNCSVKSEDQEDEPAVYQCNVSLGSLDMAVRSQHEVLKYLTHGRLPVKLTEILMDDAIEWIDG